MASAKKNQIAPHAGDIDFSKFLPEGMDVGDLYKTGGLTPIMNPELAFEKGAVVAGYIDRIQVLPLQRAGTADEWQPLMILVRELTAPVACMAKDPKGDDTEVIVEKGKECLVPVTGNLKTNRELLTALMDRTQAHFAIFRVVGTMDVGRASPMWSFDIRLHPKTKQRVGAYALPSQDDPSRLFSKTKDGTGFVDNATGEVVGKDGKPVKSLVDQPGA